MVLSNKSLKIGVLWVRFWTYLSYLSLYSHPTKNWCFWTVVLEKILESPLDCKEIKPVHLEISPEYSLKGLMLKLKLQYFGHLMRRAGSLKKTLMLGKIEGRRRRGATENEMVGWHHQHNGHEFQQALGVGDGQGGLACCSPWVARRWTWLSDWTEVTLFSSTALNESSLMMTQICISSLQHGPSIWLSLPNLYVDVWTSPVSPL